MTLKISDEQGLSLDSKNWDNFLSRLIIHINKFFPEADVSRIELDIVAGNLVNHFRNYKIESEQCIVLLVHIAFITDDKFYASDRYMLINEILCDFSIRPLSRCKRALRAASLEKKPRGMCDERELPA